MAKPLDYSFGEINTDTVGRWLHLAPEDDGPVWMLNLMKYRDVADYGDGADSGISGRAADDAYAPVDVLADLGAVVALFGDVTGQLAGSPAWDRIGIVRYPTRASFFAMQNRDDFQEQYVHKKAGMEFTIVMGCLPDTTDEGPGAPDGKLVVRVRRFAGGAASAPDPAGVTPVARFDVDGVVLGDHRTWDEVRFDRVEEGAMAGLTAVEGIEDQEIVVVDPFIDVLVDSVRTSSHRPTAAHGEVTPR